MEEDLETRSSLERKKRRLERNLIVLTVLAINFVGDWLTEVLHPRSVL